MRKMNKIIHNSFKRRLKVIKLNVLYKIIEANEEQFKKSPNCDIEVSKYSCGTLFFDVELKNNILHFAN